MEKQKLLQQASKLEDLQEFANLAYQILDNPIFIEDRSGVILCHTADVEIDAPEWKDLIQSTGKHAPSAKQIKEVDELFRDAFENPDAKIVSNDNFMACPRMIKPLIIQQEHAGTMVCAAHCRDFTEEDVANFEILASFACNIINNNQYIISGKHDKIDNFLIKLLLGNSVPLKSIRTHLEILNWDTKPYHYVMILCPKQLSQAPDMPLYEITEIMQQQNNLHAFIFDSRVVCLCASEQAVDSWESQFPVLTSALNRFSLFAGISQSFENPSQMSMYYKQAQEICKVAGILQKENTYFSYNEFSVYCLFSQLNPAYNLRDYCHEKILELEHYDLDHNADLVPTLHCYLETGCSIAKTAERLYVHRNTVYYRIQKCQELLDRDFDDTDFFFAAIFSMHILEYENKRIGRMPPKLTD